jgi:hypothetical protein
MGIAQIVFFVIFGPNGDFDKEIMKGKRRFGARFGFAFLRGGEGRNGGFVCSGGEGPSLGGAGHSALVKKTHKMVFKSRPRRPQFLITIYRPD